jgi:hypothetical protein
MNFGRLNWALHPLCAASSLDVKLLKNISVFASIELDHVGFDNFVKVHVVRYNEISFQIMFFMNGPDHQVSKKGDHQ